MSVRVLQRPRLRLGVGARSKRPILRAPHVMGLFLHHVSGHFFDQSEDRISVVANQSGDRKKLLHYKEVDVATSPHYKDGEEDGEDKEEKKKKRR